MKKYYLNPSKMVELARSLEGVELKVLFAIIYCLNESNRDTFFNNIETRDKFSEFGLAKSPERFSSILGALTKKGILKREINGVYSIKEDILICP